MYMHRVHMCFKPVSKTGTDRFVCVENRDGPQQGPAGHVPPLDFVNKY